MLKYPGLIKYIKSVLAHKGVSQNQLQKTKHTDQLIVQSDGQVYGRPYAIINKR